MDLQKDYSLYSVFMKVCELKNYSKVATLLNYSSPQTIKDKMVALAAQVGVKTLFHGHSRGVEPTSEALELLKRVKPHFDAIDFAEKDVKDFNESSEASLTITISATILNFTLTEYFAEFLRKYPKVQFKFYNRAQQENYKLLLNREIDFVIDLAHQCKHYKLKTIELFDLNCFFIASKKFLAVHGLGAEITRKELEQLPIIGDPELIDFIKDNQLALQPQMLTASSESIFPLVKKGMGIGYYYDKLFNGLEDKGDVVKVQVKDVKLGTYPFVCGHNTEHLTKVAQVFIDGLVKFCQEKIDYLPFTISSTFPRIAVSE